MLLATIVAYFYKIQDIDLNNCCQKIIMYSNIVQLIKKDYGFALHEILPLGRYLRQQGMKYRKIKKCLPLKPLDKIKWLDFAKKWLRENHAWERTIFSDKSGSHLSFKILKRNFKIQNYMDLVYFLAESRNRKTSISNAKYQWVIR